MNPKTLQEIHKLASLHRGLLKISGVCTCFFCCECFFTEEVKEWIDDDKTALCPKCGIDTVLPILNDYRKISHSVVKSMYKYYFEDIDDKCKIHNTRN